MASPVDLLLAKRSKSQQGESQQEAPATDPQDLRTVSDPNNLRSPRAVSRYAGLNGSDFGTAVQRTEPTDHEGERELDEIMYAAGYRGDASVEQDPRGARQNSDYLKRVRGF